MALTFGRNVQPARESKLLVDMMCLEALRKAPKSYHAAKIMLLREEEEEVGIRQQSDKNNQ